jgi:hypothetical protein
VSSRDNASARAADTWRLDVFDQAWKGAAAAVDGLLTRLRMRWRHPTIHVASMSEEWLAAQAWDTPKHSDDG